MRSFQFSFTQVNQVTEQGELILPCGAKYVGSISNGKPAKSGRVATPMTLPKGELYVGELENGIPHGDGIITFPEKFSIEGKFQIYPFGNTLDSCYVKTGVVRDMSGRKISGYHSGIEYFNYGVYSGDYVVGLREGFGLFVDSKRDRYEGSFSRDKMHGLVLATSAAGEQTEMLYADGECQQIERKHKTLPAELVERKEAAQKRWAAQAEADQQLKLVEQLRAEIEAATAELGKAVTLRLQSSLVDQCRNFIEEMIAKDKLILELRAEIASSRLKAEE